MPLQEKPNEKENPYESLRRLALSTTEDALGLHLPEDAFVVYGIVEDISIGNGIATLVAFQTGDASIYLSSGGGFIGGGQSENIRHAALAFIEKGNSSVVNAIKTTGFPPPGKDEFVFYFLTNKGIYTAKDHQRNLQTSKWRDLFFAGDRVISAYRENNQRDQK